MCTHSFNINIVECKFIADWSTSILFLRFNINIVECKLKNKGLKWQYESRF